MVNKVILVGHVGKDPEIKTVGETKVAQFSIATSKSWKNKEGEKQEKTTWHNIVIWRGLAEVVEKFVKKGDKLYLEGEIDNRSYEKDGETKYISEIIASQMQMLGSKSSGGGGSTAPPATEPDATDDLPF